MNLEKRTEGTTDLVQVANDVYFATIKNNIKSNVSYGHISQACKKQYGKKQQEVLLGIMLNKKIVEKNIEVEKGK